MAAVTALLGGAVLWGMLVGVHPMHTSITDLVHDPRSGQVTIVIRTFVDDFSSAAGGVGDSSAAAYLRPRLSLTDRTGRPVVLRLERVEPVGEAVLLRLRGHAPGGLSGGRLRQALLCDRFDDQVNVVRVAAGPRRVSLLFVAGDEAKTLP